MLAKGRAKYLPVSPAYPTVHVTLTAVNKSNRSVGTVRHPKVIKGACHVPGPIRKLSHYPTRLWPFTAPLTSGLKPGACCQVTYQVDMVDGCTMYLLLFSTVNLYALISYSVRSRISRRLTHSRRARIQCCTSR